MMGEIDFGDKLPDGIGPQNIQQGYGDPNWVKASSHWKYVHAARDHRLAKGKGGKWVAFALRDVATEQAQQQAEATAIPAQISAEDLYGPAGYALPYDIPIKAQEGDVLIKARSGKYTNSHGSIVVQVGASIGGWIFSEEIPIDRGQLLLADGNMSNTNSVKKYSGIIDQNGYYLADNSQEYLIVLKRFE